MQLLVVVVCGSVVRGAPFSAPNAGFGAGDGAEREAQKGDPRNRCANYVFAERVASAPNPRFEAEDVAKRGVIRPCLGTHVAQEGLITHPVNHELRSEPRVRCANNVLAERVVSAAVSRVPLRTSSFATSYFKLAPTTLL